MTGNCFRFCSPASKTGLPFSSRVTSLLFILYFGACFCLSHRVLAWSAGGHMVVAQIAYNHLDPAVKAACDALIAVPLTYRDSGSTNFITASCWADDYKGALGTGAEHYIDLAFSLDGTSTNGVGPDLDNVVLAINNGIFYLGYNYSQSSKATYLRYLIHFVGDIHQPNHCSTAVFAAARYGDYGGNYFYLYGNWSKLHYLWDDGGGYLTNWSRPLSASDQAALDSQVAAIEADYPYTPQVGTIPDPLDWARAGRDLAMTNAYVGITNNTFPTAAYTSKVQGTTEQLMAIAGHRLADLLNTIFSTNAVRLVCSPTNGSFRFSWAAIPGRNYRVEWKQQLGDPAWNTLTNIVVSRAPRPDLPFYAGYTNSIYLSETSSQAQRFYRVVQWSP